MAVLMVNASLGVRRRQDGGRDAHGEPLPADWAAVGALLPGRVSEAADGSWSLGADPSLWPVRQRDLLVDDAGNEWLVDTADLIQNNLDDSVDWIKVTAHQRTAAGSTEPGGPEYVGR